MSNKYITKSLRQKQKQLFKETIKAQNIENGIVIFKQLKITHKGKNEKS